MSKSRTEISLQELHQEINEIVKGSCENDTSYFPNALKLLSAFENYLKCLDIGQNCQNPCQITGEDCFLFREEVRMDFFMEFRRFWGLVGQWNFGFNDQLRQIIETISYEENLLQQKALTEISIVEIVFLMYLCLEVQRKQIIGKGFETNQNRMFLLKEIIKILAQFSPSPQKSTVQSDHTSQMKSFSINEEKLLKIILLKTLKLKLHKENFSFGSMNPKKDQCSFIKGSMKGQSFLIDSNMGERDNEGMEKNFSLVSVQSNFQESQVLDQKVEIMKQDQVLMPLQLNHNQIGLEMQNLSNDDIFNSISLNELRGYISH